MNDDLIDLNDELFSPLSDEEKAVITGSGTSQTTTKSKSVTVGWSGMFPDVQVMHDNTQTTDSN